MRCEPESASGARVGGPSRRRVLKAAGLALPGLLLPRIAFAANGSAAVLLDRHEGLYCAYAERGTGTIRFVKAFAEVNPEVLSGRQPLVPYKAPTSNVWIGGAHRLFKDDVTRFAIVDMAERNRDAGWFSDLKDSYTPEEYTHHFLLTLADRELARAEVGGWAQSEADEGQQAAAAAMFEAVHAGFNGKPVRDDPDRRADAERFYAGREVLRPVLFLGAVPAAGSQAFLGPDGVMVAATGTVQVAQGAGAVAGGVALAGQMAADVSLAAEGATAGASAPGASVGHAAATGAEGGASSGAGDGGSGSGGSGSGAGGGDSCFRAGTRVWMADGTMKPIEMIEVGESVVGFDARTRTQRACPVTRLYGAEADHWLDIDGLRVTRGHPFGKDGAWIEAGDLHPGAVVTGDGGPVRIEAIERHDRPCRIYNLTVGGTHTYYVEPGAADGGSIKKKRVWFTTRERVGATAAVRVFSLRYLVHNKGGGSDGTGSGKSEAHPRPQQGHRIGRRWPGKRLMQSVEK